MKTPEKWLEIRTSALHDGDTYNADLHRWISKIQLDAFKEGRNWGLRESADLFNYCQVWKKDFIVELLHKHSETPCNPTTTGNPHSCADVKPAASWWLNLWKTLKKWLPI